MQALDTNCYLAVRQKHSYGFSQLLSGHYRRGQLPDIVSACLPEELTNVKPEQFFNSEARERYYANVDMINPDRAQGKVVWGFPKGRRQSAAEQDLDAAQREFREETGLDYPHDATVVNVTVERIYDLNKQYIIKYWLVTVPTELPLPAEVDCPEIAECKWMSYPDLRKVLSPTRLSLLAYFSHRERITDSQDS